MGSIVGRVIGGVFCTLLGMGTGYLVFYLNRPHRKNTIGFTRDK